MEEIDLFNCCLLIRHLAFAQLSPEIQSKVTGFKFSRSCFFRHNHLKHGTIQNDKKLDGCPVALQTLHSVTFTASQDHSQKLDKNHCHMSPKRQHTWSAFSGLNAFIIRVQLLILVILDAINLNKGTFLKNIFY